MDQIVLNEFGETLVVQKPYTHDGIVGAYAEMTIGYHEYCKGYIGNKTISVTHSALHCKVCNLRIVIPVNIDTYEKLRQWCAGQIESKKHHAQEIRHLIDDHTVIGPIKNTSLPDLPPGIFIDDGEDVNFGGTYTGLRIKK